MPPVNRLDSFDVTPATDEETQSFLENDTDQDTIQGDKLWNEHSGMPGLLDATGPIVTNAKARREYTYDPKTGRYRYRDSGRLVPESRIRSSVTRTANASRDEMRQLTQKLNNGSITLERWYKEMRQLMKNAYRDAWLVSIGGRQNYDKRQQALFGRAAKQQYQFLNKFLADIKSGKQKLDGTAMVRAGMYGKAMQVFYQNNLVQMAVNRGMNEGRRIRTATESCVTCVAHGISELERNSEKGWMPISEMRQFGDSECKSHCLCYGEYRNTTPIPSPLGGGVTLFQGPF